MMNKKKAMHQVVVDLLQQVSDLFIRVLVFAMPIRHEEVHNSAIGPVVGHGVELHEVFILRHFIILRDGHQRLDRRHEW